MPGLRSTPGGRLLAGMNNIPIEAVPLFDEVPVQRLSRADWINVSR